MVPSFSSVESYVFSFAYEAPESRWPGGEFAAYWYNSERSARPDLTIIQFALQHKHYVSHLVSIKQMMQFGMVMEPSLGAYGPWSLLTNMAYMDQLASKRMFIDCIPLVNGLTDPNPLGVVHPFPEFVTAATVLAYAYTVDAVDCAHLCQNRYQMKTMVYPFIDFFETLSEEKRDIVRKMHEQSKELVRDVLHSLGYFSTVGESDESDESEAEMDLGSQLG